MLRFSSLQTRVLVLTVIPLSLLVVAFLALVLHSADGAVRRSMSASLSDAGSVFVKLLATRRSEVLTMATVTARDPRFFATLSIDEEERGPEFAPTLRGVAVDFLRITDADFIEVFDGEGRFVCYVDRNGGAEDGGTAAGSERDAQGRRAGVGRRGIEAALAGAQVADFYLAEGHLVVAGIVPVFVSQRIEAVLRMGSFFDREFVAEVKRLTGAEVCLTHAGREIASTYPEAAGGGREAWTAAVPVRPALGDAHFTMSDAYTGAHRGTTYLVVRVHASGFDPSDGFDAYLGRELRTELAPMVTLTKRLAALGAVAVVATWLAAWALAVRITGPLSSVVRAAKELQAGQYDRPLGVSGRDEVAFLARSFEEMRASLQKHVEHLRNLDQMKSNFIALAGHELKTPLTVITGFNDMIVSGLMGEVPEKVRETTQLIQLRLQDLNRLVENILDMTRFDQGLHDLHLARSDLRGLAAEVVDSRRRNLEGRELEITLHAPPEPCTADVDVGRVRQALGHLLDNAVRFTPDGGRIDVAVRREGGSIAVAVRDTGIGIPANELDWIFDKIYEVGDVLNHSSGRLAFGSRGMGMGLALCRAIVEGHGGCLRVKSAVGLGSEFTVELRAATPVLEPEPAVVG